MTDKSEEEPDGYIDIPHLNAKIPFWNVPPVSLMDANPIYISKEDREKLLKTRADMCKNYAHAKTKVDIIKCSICGNSFAARFPKTGDSVTCPHCGAEGHGTYDEGGNYMLEWHESDTWS